MSTSCSCLTATTGHTKHKDKGSKQQAFIKPKPMHSKHEVLRVQAIIDSLKTAEDVQRLLTTVPGLETYLFTDVCCI